VDRLKEQVSVPVHAMNLKFNRNDHPHHKTKAKNTEYGKQDRGDHRCLSSELLPALKEKVEISR
jgi:hypothetical protein